MLRGTMDEKAIFIFAMFDMDGTHVLNREELRAMLNSVVFASSTILESSNIEAQDDVERMNDDARVHILDDQVEALYQNAFEDFSPEDADASLTLDKFQMWVVSNPDLYDLFETTFHTSASLAGFVPDETDSSAPATITSSSSSSSAGPPIVGSGPIADLARSMRSHQAAAAASAAAASTSSESPLREPTAFSSLSSSPSILSANAVAATAGGAATGSSPNASAGKAHSPDGSQCNSPTEMRGLDSHPSSHGHSASHPSLSSLHGHGHHHLAPSSSRGLNRRASLKTAASSPGCTVSCSHCGHQTRVSFCFSCGTMLGSENRPCRTCGEQFNGHMIKFCILCGFDLSLNNTKIEPPLQRSFHQKHEAPVQGFLFKLGATFKQLVLRWFVLKDSFLYSFRDRADVQPSTVTFLEGCFIELLPAESEKLRFGIDIIISDGGCKQDEQHRVLYAKSSEERDQWATALRKATNVHNIHDFYEIGQELGTGRFSSVRLGTHKVTGKQYAIKIIDKEHMDQVCVSRMLVFALGVSSFV